MRFFRVWAFGLVVMVIGMALAACTATPTEAPLPDPQTLLNKAATEVQNAKSVKIKLQLTGAPSYVDPPLTPGGPGNTIAFISADGVYVGPDRVSASVVASILGIPGKVDVTAIGDDQWMKNQILTAGRWVKRIFSPGFNAAKLISSDSGIQSALRALKDLKVVGRENTDGVQMYHVTGKAAGADIGALTVGLIRGSDVVVDIYIPIDTGRVDRVIMVQPETVSAKEPKPTTWSLELFDYNSDAQIAAPDTGDTVATTQAAAQTTAQATVQATSEATQAK